MRKVCALAARPAVLLAICFTLAGSLIACGDSSSSGTENPKGGDSSTPEGSTQDSPTDGGTGLMDGDSAVSAESSSEAEAGGGTAYRVPDNQTGQAQSFGSSPGVLFRWRADGTSTSPGTLSSGVVVSELTRPAPFSSFKFASFEGAATGKTPGYVGKDSISFQAVGFTVEAWLLAKAVDGTRTLFSNTGSNRGVSFDLKDGRLQVLFSTDDKGTAYRHTVQDNTILKSGQWYSAAVSVAVRTSELRVAFFVDGLRTAEEKISLDHGSELLDSTELPAVAGEPTSGALEGEGFSGDLHAVMVHNYPITDNILGAPWLRESGRYLGMPSYHDYLQIPEPSGTAKADPPYSDRRINFARRVGLTDSDSRFPSQAKARTRLGLPLLNDRFVPSGVAFAEDGRTLWLGYHYVSDQGTNPDSRSSLIAEVDLPSYRLERVYFLQDAAKAALASKLGGLTRAGKYLYASVGNKVLTFDLSTAKQAAPGDAAVTEAPALYEVQATASYAVRSPNAGLAYDELLKALWLAEYGAAEAALDRYDLAPDGAIAHPSETTSDERIELPESMHSARGVVPYPQGGTKCFLVASHAVEAVGAATASRIYPWCVGDKAAAARLRLAAGAQALTIGPDQTLWVLNQSGGAFYQKTTAQQPWYDVLNPYLTGFELSALKPTIANCVQGTLKPYLGDVHAHTSYSDGKKLPKDEFAYARDDVKLDFLAITDHSGSLTDTEYSDCKSAAAAATSASFVASCGFEISMKTSGGDVIGHGNVLFADKHLPYPADPPAFYKLLVGCKGCLGQINHPASINYPWTNEGWSSVGDPVLALAEFNGAALADARKKYHSLLDHGWHLAPSMNSDTHSMTPGGGGRRTGIFAASLDLASIKEAFAERRTFAGNAGNGSSLRLQAEGCWMGARLQGYLQASVQVQAIDPKVGFKSIDLLGAGGKKVKSIDCASKTDCSETIQLEIDPSTDRYIIAFATRTDDKFLVSAPIWIEN